MSNKIVIKVKGVELQTWLSVRLQRNFDSVDTLSISYPFDPKNETLKEVFKPCSFNECRVFYDGKLLFVGVLLDVRTRFDSNQVVEEASFYALSGNLIDCNFPASSTKLQFDNQTIKTIFTQIADQFNLNLTFAAEAGGSFDKVACRPDQKIFDFMIDLAKQRGLILSSLANGGILVRKGKENGTLVAKLEEGLPPLVSVTNNPNSRNYFSEVTACTTGRSKDNINAKYTSNNNKLDFLRPMIKVAKDTDTGSIKNASEGLLGRMFASSINYTIVVPSWENSLNKVFETNTFVQIKAPSVRIYQPYTLMIKQAELIADNNQELTSLTCVLPSSYSNKVPETLPWD